jgi:hypothetical protein
MTPGKEEGSKVSLMKFGWIKPQWTNSWSEMPGCCLQKEAETAQLKMNSNVHSGI